MGVVARSDGRVYDIEMQVVAETNLGKRMRYYQAALDASELGPGQRFGELSESYIVFFCLFDPYGFGRPLYRLDRHCADEPTLRVGDESHRVVLNATAWLEASDAALGDLLRYVETGESTGSLSSAIDELVSSFNQDQGWVRKIMLLEEEVAYRCQLEREKGIEQGIEQGASCFAALAKRLVAEGRIEDIIAAADSPATREKLLVEFGLEGR